MYINIIFALYIIAMLISLVCLVFIGLILVRKNDRENKIYISVRRFASVVLLTDLLYFIFYYREVVSRDYELATPFRIVDYLLCDFLFFCWILVLANIINRDKHKRVVQAGAAVTAVRIIFSLIITIVFMGQYYNIDNPEVRLIWMVSEACFILITALIIIYCSIYGIIESVSRLRRNYIIVCSVLLLFWSVLQGIIDMGLFAGKYGVSAWEVETPDFTGAVLFLVNLATCVFVFREDFSPLFFGDDVYVAESADIDEKLDFIAAAHKLTVREREVLGLVYMGNTNPDIAEALFISVNTVKKHIRNIYEKLDVKSRSEVIHLINARNIKNDEKNRI